jgi:hypothetical protein
VSKADGVPLFVEELTRMVMESGLLRERDGHYELRGPLHALALSVPDAPLKNPKVDGCCWGCGRVLPTMPKPSTGDRGRAGPPFFITELISQPAHGALRRRRSKQLPLAASTCSDAQSAAGVNVLDRLRGRA